MSETTDNCGTRHRRLRENREIAGSDAPAVPDLDCRRLNEQLGHDRELLRDLVLLFIEDCPGQLDQLERGICTNQPRLVRLQAHLLIGTAAHFGAWAVYQYAHRLERMGAAADLTDAEIVFSELRYAVARVQPLLLDLVSGPN